MRCLDILQIAKANNNGWNIIDAFFIAVGFSQRNMIKIKKKRL
jgi:hypothetical protein